MSQTKDHRVEASSDVALHDPVVRLHHLDNVGIATNLLQPGTILTWGSAESRLIRVAVREPIPSAHKIALREIRKGQKVLRYGQAIGIALQDIHPGEHIHTHNLGLGPSHRTPSYAGESHPTIPLGKKDPRTILGYCRMDGRVGTRNYILVISTVNCSAHVCQQIAHHFTPDRLSAYPNVDGVIALTVQGGCTAQVGGQTHSMLRRTLAGMARHPNAGAYLLVGLGCETNQAATLIQDFGLDAASGSAPAMIVIQEAGGTGPAIAAGISAVAEMLPRVNDIRRTPQPLAHLTLALQCGGSDGWSGVTANPVVGLVSDELVRQGGTVVLAETPEIFGAEHLLSQRAVGPEVAFGLDEQMRWWEAHTRRLGTEIDNNPSPGNKAGGLTTIYEKALGAVAKSGSSQLMAVIDYAESAPANGLVFMNTPGFDPVSVTGQVAGGCNLVLFTTGRGSTFGFKPAPCIKVASNTTLAQKMPGDIDFDAGRVLAGSSLDQLAGELFELVVAIASGQPSKSEAQGIGEAEFNPWHLGDTL